MGTMNAAEHAELPKTYRPADHEDRIRIGWMQANAFAADPGRVVRGEAKPFSILIPPPNVTARLHLGHALNNTLQDVLTRVHRMMGFEALWMPGTDHAGIATQAVVERRLWEEEQKRRHDFAREDFVERVQVWKDDYEKQITDQLKLMGCSCDLDRQRFTMDDICAKAVREAFFRLFSDGLIYRGKRLVNWDPALQTAVADDECFEEEIDTSFWNLRYPLVHNGKPVTWSTLATRGYPGASELPADEQAWVTVATTRPETYLADTAVAVNPHDPRANALRGLSVQLPLVGRVIPIVEDSYVVLPEAMARTEEEKNDPKAKFATGFLKVTPGHDKNDYEIGQRHKLPIINMMSPDGKVSDKHGWTDVGSGGLFIGLTMQEARKKVVAEFKSHGLMEAIKPYRQTVTISDRSKARIEPYLSDQWYVRVTDPRLAASANAALVTDQRSHRGGSVLRTGLQDPWRTHPLPIHLTKKIASFVPRDPYPPGRPSPDDLMVTVRALPHVQLPGATYFITWRCASGVTLNPVERQMTIDAIRHFEGDRIVVHACCVMPDHVHAIITPLADHSLLDWAASVKRFAARAMNAASGLNGSVWQEDHFDHIVRDHTWLEAFLNYIVENPAKEGLVEAAGRYEWTYLSPDVQSAIKDGAKAGSENRPTNGDDASMRFFPARYSKTFEQWHDNIRDWCISRQLWWGHRIPVWSKLVGYGMNDQDSQSFTVEHNGKLPGEGRWSHQIGSGFIHLCIRNPDDHEAIKYFESQGFSQDPDVLDTWFSSALWPLSTMGWPEPEQAATKGLLQAYNPSTVLCTAREIITLWVSRMTMFNRYFRQGTIPFRHVYIHAVVQDGEGQKMSKSLGNGVDPIDIIETHGSDAMRFTLCQMATQTQDVRLSVDVLDPHTGEAFAPKMITNSRGDRVAAPLQEHKGKKMVSSYGAISGEAKAEMATLPVAKNTSSKFDLGRNFANKIWNASRFTLSILDRPLTSASAPASPANTDLIDGWMLTRLSKTVRELEHALANYEFAHYAQILYRFVWDDFCDWYLEAIKPTVEGSPRQRAVLAATLHTALALAHPVMPFITEAIWEQLSPRLAGMPRIGEVTFAPPRKGNLLCTSGWPELSESAANPAAEAAFERVKALVTAIREVRAAQSVQPRRKITLHVPAAAAASWAASHGLVGTLAGVELFQTDASQGPAVRFTFEGAEYALSNLADQVDAGAERLRLSKLIAEKEKSIATMQGRLNNPGYAAKAPPSMVEQTKAQLAKDQAEVDAAKATLAALGT